MVMIDISRNPRTNREDASGTVQVVFTLKTPIDFIDFSQAIRQKNTTA